jgi:hypothetical protein
MHSTLRRLFCTAGLALTALVTAGGSGATVENAVVCNAAAQSCMTDGEYRALLIRSVALNRKYGLGD